MFLKSRLWVRSCNNTVALGPNLYSWPERAPSRQSGIGGVEGHNMKQTSFAHILFATGVPGKPRPVGGELHFAYISRKFPSDPRLFFSENEEISTPPLCGFLIGIYLFYENWSTETFRNEALIKLGNGSYILIEAPRLPRQDGAGTAGLPGIV
jgi:hypothetical protein